MKFFMPTEVLIGKNIVKENSERFKAFGKKALIVTGKSSSKKNGSLDNIIEVLTFNKIDYIIFDEVEENPSVETVCIASELGKKENVDFIIGVGGGSPIDASKAISIMIKNKDLTKDTIFTEEKLDGIPLIAVPTTCGTGTETTQYSILTDNKEKIKRNLGQEVFPKLSLLDPLYTMNMPLETTRNTAMDALSHIIEGYLNTNSTIITDGIVKIALEEFSKAIDGLIKGNLSFEDRESLAIASNLAGIIIAHTGTSLPHGLGYALTYNKGVPHGLANGCLYIEYLKVFKNREKVDNIYKLLGFRNENELEDFLRIIGKAEVNVTEGELKSYTKEFLKNKSKLKNHPEDITEEEIYLIYKNSLL